MIYIEGLKGWANNIRLNGCNPLLILNKQDMFDTLVNDMFSRTYMMFEYSDYPETFDPLAFERALQMQGFCIVKDVQDTEKEKGIYALLGVGLGGMLDASYIPTKAVGANPYLNITIEDEIGKDCVMVWNDKKLQGLCPLMSFYGGMLAEAYMTLRLMLVLHRAPNFIKAGSEDEAEEARSFLKDLEDGKLGIIAGSDTLQNLVGGTTLDTKKLTGDSHNSLKEVIEVIQYIRGQWFIALGLNDNFNMKREALNSAETEANIDTLFPGVDAMLQCRQKGIDEINAKYGTNIKVKLASSWERVQEREDIAMENAEAQADAVEQATDEKPADEPPAEEKKEEDSENE